MEGFCTLIWVEVEAPIVQVSDPLNIPVHESVGKANQKPASIIIHVAGGCSNL